MSKAPEDAPSREEEEEEKGIDPLKGQGKKTFFWGGGVQTEELDVNTFRTLYKKK